MRVRKADDGSSTDSRIMRLAVFQAVSAARVDLVAGHDLLLDLLGPADRRSSCCRSSANSNRNRVAERRSSWSGLRRTLSVKSISSRWIRSPTRWSTQRGDQVGESRSTTRSMISPAFSDHWKARSASSWSSASWRCSCSSVDSTRPIGGPHCGSAIRLTIIRSSTCWTSSSRSISHQYPQHRGRLGGHPLGVRGLRQPLAEPAGDFGVAQLGLDDLRRHEVLPDEGCPDPRPAGLSCA